MKLNQLINKLNTDALCAVDVFESSTNEVLFKNCTHATILQEYQSAENFLEHLKSIGHTEITLIEKRKSGNAFSKKGDLIKIAAEPVTEIETEKTAVAKKKKKKKKQSKAFGLGMGLSMPDVISLHSKADKVDELKETVRDLRLENRSLTKRNEELREQELLRKYTLENNDSRNLMLFEGFKQIPLVLSSMGVKVPMAGGLAGAESELDNLSEVQIELFQAIKKTDDTMNQILINLLDKTENSNDEFSKVFYAFLIKNQIIQP